MEYRPFGQTGIQVSAIGLGCWEIGGGYGKIEEEEFMQAVHRALDLSPHQRPRQPQCRRKHSRRQDRCHDLRPACPHALSPFCRHLLGVSSADRVGALKGNR